MRITFVVPVLDLSGGARIIAGHAQRLAAKGHEVVIVAPPPHKPTLRDRVKALLRIAPLARAPQTSHYAVAGVPVHITANAGPVGAADVPDADVIVATWWETAEWIWAMPSSKGAKVHFIQHYEAFANVPEERVVAVWRLPTFKIAVAKWLVDLGRERFGIEQLALVPNSVDHELFKAQVRSKGEPPTVGFLFHNADFKDIPTTLAAIRQLKQIKPEVRLVSFGGSMPAPGQLPADCEFHHLPSQEKIARLYARCDAWLSTSRTEGFNLPPLEAMASGCPAVCARTGRPLEIIHDSVNGYVVDQGDISGFVDALLKIVSLPHSDWEKMSEAAVRTVAHPTWQESNALFEEALMRSLERMSAAKAG